jgi:hypothetical protein
VLTFFFWRAALDPCLWVRIPAPFNQLLSRDNRRIKQRQSPLNLAAIATENFGWRSGFRNAHYDKKTDQNNSDTLTTQIDSTRY